LAIRKKDFAKYFPHLWSIFFTKQLEGKRRIPPWELRGYWKKKNDNEEAFPPYSLSLVRDWVCISRTWAWTPKKIIRALVRTLTILERNLSESKGN